MTQSARLNFYYVHFDGVTFDVAARSESSAKRVVSTYMLPWGFRWLGRWATTCDPARDPVPLTDNGYAQKLANMSFVER